MGWRVKESTMSSDVDVQPVPVNTNTIRTRGGVTGHNVRYVLAFGLAGIIIAFAIVGLYFGDVRF
jgi:hypothetical protein